MTYDPATRKLTFTKTTTFTTADDVDAKIAAKVGELKVGEETFATVKAYVDKKTDGIATDAALETLTGRVTTAETKISTLVGDVPISRPAPLPTRSWRSSLSRKMPRSLWIPWPRLPHGFSRILMMLLP